MNEPGTIFCEGDSDKKFLADLLEYLGIFNVNVTAIGGGVGRLANVAPLIRQAVDRGDVALILDANSGVDSRRAKIAEILATEDIVIGDVFLLPNNCDPGDLETLLKQLCLEEHRAIHDCFEEYTGCLADRSSMYRRPSGKEQIYAYCQALGIDPRAPRRNYLDEDCWNLDAAAEPLMKFLGNWAGRAKCSGDARP